MKLRKVQGNFRHYTIKNAKKHVKGENPLLVFLVIKCLDPHQIPLNHELLATSFTLELLDSGMSLEVSLQLLS